MSKEEGRTGMRLGRMLLSYGIVFLIGLWAGYKFAFTRKAAPPGSKEMVGSIGDGHCPRRLPLATLPQADPHSGSMSVVPGDLSQQPAGIAVTVLANASSMFSLDVA